MKLKVVELYNCMVCTLIFTSKLIFILLFRRRIKQLKINLKISRKSKITEYKQLLPRKGQNIDFYINGLSTKYRLRSQRIPTEYKMKINNCKLIGLVIRIELTWAILMPRFYNFLGNSIIHFHMFLYLETCFLRAMIFGARTGYKLYQRYIFQFFIILLVNWDEIVWPRDGHSDETVFLRQQVTKYKNMRKSMVEFLRKFENRGIRTAWVNSILITKYINLQLFT